MGWKQPLYQELNDEDDGIPVTGPSYQKDMIGIAGIAIKELSQPHVELELMPSGTISEKPP